MRILATLLILLALGWGGAWLVGARMIERSAETWFAEQELAGMVADFEALSVGGFPMRMELEVERVRLGDPRLATGWELPGLTAGWQATAPGRLQMALEGGHRLVVAGEMLELDAATLAGHVQIGGRALALREVALEAASVRLAAASPELGGAALDRLDLRLEARPAAPQRLELALSLRGLVLEGLDGGPATPLDRLDMTGQLLLDAPLDRHAVRPPQPVALIVEAGTLVWGETRGRAEGRLDIDADGRPEGRIELEVTAWRPLLELAVALGTLEPELAPTWERVLETLEEADDRPGVLSMPLVYRAGRVSLGPLPLGPAPRLRF